MEMKTIYNFVHFRLTPSKTAVLGINSKEDFENKIEEINNKEVEIVLETAHKWFETIVKHPARDSSERIWKEIEQILNK